MGADVEARSYTREERRRYRDKVALDLQALRRMLDEGRVVDADTQAGLEVEFNLVDARLEPDMRNAEVLAAIDSPSFQTELGRFNVEINLPPQALRSGGLRAFEDQTRQLLTTADERASRVGSRLVMIGILPTLMPEHVHADQISENPRYSLLDAQILAARGENLQIDIEGREERLQLESDSIMPEAACTSTQVHLQIDPSQFGAVWNAAQAVTGIQVALAANSPFLFGHRLMAENRIPLFAQSTDTRGEDLKAQGVRPRVWFGERWVQSIFDLFEENARYYSALLPECSDEDPMAVLDAGGVPALSELSLHNGTIYRWNRPIYAVADGAAHLRVESRVLPAGPTVVDTIANAAFFAGVVRALSREPRPVWREMSFLAAQDNLDSAVRDGISAVVYWPGAGQVGVAELVLRRLLPLARAGLADQGVSEAEIDRYLSVVEQRCLLGRNGATWQTAHVGAREAAGESRQQALRGMLAEYVDLMHAGEPVHTWEDS
ncbi:glutamate--cysteine ligase [Auraticoccus sp. F435]|uniref:Glutamate--cysteine ligase n=1 Tax=Auraticoccus cholistanensis TaxID=2656650 RepID=A0A6A9UVJ2_9ACTN|nr:glutamate--cysteine ligase [Auraticoccus cholistanensis]MVA75695.1 glutamate--cysteine ligase [Auraticoccus cholistanensis]